MRFSIVLIPDHPVSELLPVIELADKLGFYACYGADETFHKDAWQLFAAAAGRTRQIRFGPDVTHVILKDPTIVAQQVATLDEISNGRAECGFSIGNVAMLDHYHRGDAIKGSIKRLREAHEVLRRMLDTGAVDYAGDFYRYRGLYTTARPVQTHLPLFIGAMIGPKSFQLAGEIADGMHHAVAYSRDALNYAADNVRIGAERAGRDWRTLDLATIMVSSISEDGAAARQAAGVIAGLYLSAVPQALLDRHGIDADEVQPTLDAFQRGDIAGGINALAPDVAARFSCAGTAADIVQQIRENIESTGFNHVVFALCDPYLVEQWSGVKVANVPDLAGQLRLLHDHVLPEFEA